MSTNFDKIGISSEEYSIYELLLKQPTLNISELARESGITRVTVYSVLDSLQEKNLIKRVDNKKTKVKYFAQSPDVLNDFIVNFKNDSEKELKELESRISTLKAIAGDTKDLDSSNLNVIRGADALDILDQLILDCGESLCGISYDYHVDACFEFDIDYRLKDNKYLELVMKLGDKFAFTGTSESIKSCQKLAKMNPFLEGKWEPRWIDNKKFKFNINLYCYGDNTAFSLGSKKQKDYLVYIIQDKNITESMRNLSLYLWDTANSIN
ncbi:MAG: helix-turn-helix domain-containing protein [Candidatus Dojkabacteria bacterium]|nr:helix-turn-helix domain-containing protein [Candidatus Dojkabacteria bacterium]MDQ7021029.1 helix-turn-helix domain-containing protein [Candidatus Dojkabacteria bacterium]